MSRLRRHCGCHSSAATKEPCSMCAPVQHREALTNRVLRSEGKPLEPAVRGVMEAKFRGDFSHVRVHTDSTAVESARAHDAKAYTAGAHLVFDAGRFSPSTRRGRRLLAHELAHTLQQRIGMGGSPDAAEREAEAAGRTADTGEPLAVSSAASDAVQRQPNQAAEADPEREAIVATAGRARSPSRNKAWEIVWRMLSRYFPEYVDRISGVTYDEAEPSARVVVRQSTVQGRQVQSGDVHVGRRFVDSTSEANLRERIQELRIALMDLRIPPDTQSLPAQQTVWRLIRENFPKKARRLALVSYDANQPGLRTEFEPGQVTVRGLTLSWSRPRLYVGKAFLAIPTEQTQVTRLGVELARIDKWAVESHHITKEDLEDEDISLRVRGLSSAQLRALSAATRDPDLKAYVESLLTISTPLEQGLTRQGGGNASVVIGNVTVIIRPDVTGANRTGAQTSQASSATPAIQYQYDAHNIVTEFHPAPGPVTITITTEYGRNAGPDAQSGYGRGTTARDQALGATTLRVHEGSHGLDYLEFLRANPYPEFTGRVGMTRTQFEAARQQYINARADYTRRMDRFSERRTDCVGVTIDQYNHTHHVQRPAVCR